MPALDTNVLLRNDATQLARAQGLVSECAARGETLFVPVTVALELEWVLRSRFELDKAAVVQVFSRLLSTVELLFEAAAALEMALKQYKAAADFSDCLHVALAIQAGERPSWTFDKAAARLAGAESLSS